MSSRRGGLPLRSALRSAKVGRPFGDGSTERLSAERILGEFDYPLPEAILEAKFVELVDQSWGAGAARAWRDLARIEEIENVSFLIAGWRPGS